jgi:hypothetical protein
VAALVRAVVVDALGSEARVNEDALRETVVVILRRIRMMPRFIGLPMVLLTVLFDLFGVLVSGRPFHRHGLEGRRRVLERWRSLPFGFCAGFADFYQKMSTFAYFHLAEQPAGAGVVRRSPAGAAGGEGS